MQRLTRRTTNLLPLGHPPTPPPQRGFLRTHPLLSAGAGLLTTAIGGFGWASFERHWMRLARVQVPTRVGTPPLRILHISDLHLTTRTTWIVDFVRDLADLEPDFVVSTGDNFNSRDALGSLTRAYSPLLEFPGAFVLGAHDYYSPYSSSWAKYLMADSRKIGDRKKHRNPDLPTPAFIDLLASHGWIYADNRAEGVTVPVADGIAEISICGTGDAHMNADRLEHIGDWPSTEDSAPDSPSENPKKPKLGQLKLGQLKLGITHAPYQRVLNRFAEAGADLIVAGHTHGGQLCVPGYGALITNCDLPRAYAAGLNQWPAESTAAEGKHSWLHVSAGLGTTYQAPFRFACRPTATLLELVPAKA